MALLDDLQKKITDLDSFIKDKVLKRVVAVEKNTEGIRNSPLIQGYNGMRLTLNESLNVLELRKTLNTMSSDILRAAQGYSDTGAANLAAAVTALTDTVNNLFSVLTANYIPKFNGTGLINSLISDDGTAATVNGILATNGYRAKNTRTTSTPFAITTSHETIWFDTDSNAIVANLPAGVSGTRLKLINCGSSGNDVTVTPNGTEKIDGVNAAKTLSDGGVLDLEYETTEGWR